MIDRMALPCWRCKHPRAADVRVWLGQASDDDLAQVSPVAGLPLMCCRIHTVPAGETARMS
jgi:hypothetical protein